MNDKSKVTLTLKQLKRLVRESSDDGLEEIKTTCPICKATHIVRVDPEGYRAWQDGELIQNAFPHLNADEREMLKTGICPDCWNGMFGDEDEDDEEEQEDNYDALHAAEWMERHPHGWYNSEDDYGTGDEEDEEEVDGVMEGQCPDCPNGDCDCQDRLIVKEDATDNKRSRAESLKLTADYMLGQVRGLCEKITKDDAEGTKLFYRNVGGTLKDFTRQFEELKDNL